MERTAKDCHIENDCQGVPQSKDIRGYHNQYNCDRVSQLKGIPGSIIINMTAREYNKLVLSGIYKNRNDCK